MLIQLIPFAIVIASTMCSTITHDFMAGIDALLHAADLVVAPTLPPTTVVPASSTMSQLLTDRKARRKLVCSYLSDHYPMRNRSIAAALEPLLANATISAVTRANRIGLIQRCRARLNLPRSGCVVTSQNAKRDLNAKAAPSPTMPVAPLELDDGDQIATRPGSSPDLVIGLTDSVSAAAGDGECASDEGLKRTREEAPSDLHSKRKRQRSRDSASISAVELGVRRRAFVRSFVVENPSVLPSGESARQLLSMMVSSDIPPMIPQSVRGLMHSCRREVGLEPPFEPKSAKAAARMHIIDAFVKEHHQENNVEMIGPVSALFEAAHLPPILPTTMQDLISRSRAKQGLLTRVSRK